MNIVSLIEATTVNAVAKGAIEFLGTARELTPAPGMPAVNGTFVIFDRRAGNATTDNEFLRATRAAAIDVDVIPERSRFDLRVVPELTRAVKMRRPDLIVTHSVKSHFLLWRSGLAKEYPWLAFHHGYTDTDRKMRIYNRLDRWSLPKADRILTVCRAFAHELAQLTGTPVERILVQHNAVRPKPRAGAEAVARLRSKLGIPESGKVILSIGRLSKEKAHADLIAAFNHLRRSDGAIDLRLVMVGEGPERAKLEAAARATDPDRIVLAGEVNDVQPFYALAHVFVLPSHSEGSPNVLLEAMAAGVPIVATRAGGVPEIVTNEESALLVPVSEPEKLMAAIDRLLNDSELGLRLTRQAAQLIATKHKPEQYVRSLTQIYADVVNARLI
jgi:glycosyltransferase involved in cell wall biosynthesis